MRRPEEKKREGKFERKSEIIVDGQAPRLGRSEVVEELQTSGFSAKTFNLPLDVSSVCNVGVTIGHLDQ